MIKKTFQSSILTVFNTWATEFYNHKSNIDKLQNANDLRLLFTAKYTESSVSTFLFVKLLERWANNNDLYFNPASLHTYKHHIIKIKNITAYRMLYVGLNPSPNLKLLN